MAALVSAVQRCESAVSVYIYVCVYINVCIHKYMCVHMCVYAHVYIHVCMHMCIYACVCTCVCIYTCVCVCVCVCPLPLEPLSHCTPAHRCRSSQSTELSSLYYTAASHWPSISHVTVYICQHYSLNSSHPLLPLLCPQVHTIHLHLYSCPENRFTSTISPDFIYIC